MYQYQYPIKDGYSPAYYEGEDRFLLAPFLLGGLAGTALGYGISSNQQNQAYPVYPMIPVYYSQPYPYPYSSYSNNNYYY